MYLLRRHKRTAVSPESQLSTFKWTFLQLRHFNFPFLPVKLFPFTGLRMRRVLLDDQHDSCTGVPLFERKCRNDINSWVSPGSRGGRELEEHGFGGNAAAVADCRNVVDQLEEWYWKQWLRRGVGPQDLHVGWYTKEFCVYGVGERGVAQCFDVMQVVGIEAICEEIIVTSSYKLSQIHWRTEMWQCQLFGKWAMDLYSVFSMDTATPTTIRLFHIWPNCYAFRTPAWTHSHTEPIRNRGVKP